MAGQGPRTTIGRGENETTEGKMDKDRARGNGDRLAWNLGDCLTDRSEGEVAGQTGGWCAGQKIGCYRFRNTEFPPTSELGVSFEQQPRQKETSK